MNVLHACWSRIILLADGQQSADPFSTFLAYFRSTYTRRRWKFGLIATSFVEKQIPLARCTEMNECMVSLPGCIMYFTDTVSLLCGFKLTKTEEQGTCDFFNFSVLVSATYRLSNGACPTREFYISD